MKFPSARGFLTLIFSGFLACLPALAGQENPTLREQFDKILRFPGDYRQNCDSVISFYPAPLPAFRSIMQPYAAISEANIEYLKKNRSGVIPILVSKLEAADLLRKPVPQPRDSTVTHPDPEGPEPIGVDPDSFNTPLLKIVEELDAVEVIPQLLVIEEKYLPMMQAFEKDASAPVPQVDGANQAKVFARNLRAYDEEIKSLRKEPKAELDRQRAIFRVQAVQRDVLAVFVRLMRNANYQPLLNSHLEALYGRVLKARFGKDEELSKFKGLNDIPDYDRHYIKFHPVHKVAWREDSDLGIPYSPDLRKEILDLTKSFIASKKKEP
jgi:hypothetical protein